MNKELIFENGYYLVKDEFNNIKRIKYTNNIDNILVQENVIEYLEKKSLSIRKDIDKIIEFSNNYINRYRKYLLIFMPINILIPIVIYNVILTFGSTYPLLISTISSLIFISSNSFFLNYYYKKTIKRINSLVKAKELSLEYVDMQIMKELNDLKSLKKEKAINKINNKTIKSHKINDNKRINEQNRVIEIYNDIGNNYEKYLKYYQNGSLQEELNDKYSYEDIMIVDNYFNKKVFENIVYKKVLKKNL